MLIKTDTFVSLLKILHITNTLFILKCCPMNFLKVSSKFWYSAIQPGLTGSLHTATHVIKTTLLSELNRKSSKKSARVLYQQIRQFAQTHGEEDAKALCYRRGGHGQLHSQAPMSDCSVKTGLLKTTMGNLFLAAALLSVWQDFPNSHLSELQPVKTLLAKILCLLFICILI